jgi:hypothetical protein
MPWPWPFLDGCFEGDMVRGKSDEFAPCLCWVLAMLLSSGFPYMAPERA